MSARAAHSRAPRGSWFALCLAGCLCWSVPSRAQPAQAAARAVERTAFHYGNEVPRELLGAYDQVVVEPDHIGSLQAFRGQAARPIAYLSLGEVARASVHAKQLDPRWVLAENRAWQSLVMDLAHPGYQAFLLQRFEQLWASGYRGFFLDTLDSYRLAAAGSEPALRGALLHIIQELHRRHPQARLLVNRGFELLEDLKGALSGVVAESLFDRWDAASHSYQRVPEADRRWLGAQLERARQLGLPVTVIDYRPPAERAEARETARRIAALGFEPWVTNATLDTLGVGSLEIVPRRVLILSNAGNGADSDALRLLGPVLEYLGYVPEQRRLPADPSTLRLGDAYQGLITWFDATPLPEGYAEWLQAQRARGLRVVLFGVPGFDVAGPLGQELGLAPPADATGATRVLEQDTLIGFEAPPPPRPFDVPLPAAVAAPGTHVHLRLTDARGQAGVAIASTSWGGFALSHVLALRGLAGERAWVLDPFAFLAQALALPAAPMPSLTTLNGRRLALIGVHPEGLAALAGHAQPSNAIALGRWLAEQHPWPHSLASTPSDARAPVSPADASAASSLLQLAFFERAELRPGSTRLGAGASLTGLGGLFAAGEPLGPIAQDAAFLPSGGAQAYAYRELLGTLERTGAPRRLTPVFVDYHAYLVGNPGGRAALGAIYGWLEQQALYPAFISEYVALARGFREQVVARALDGSFHYFGGGPLATVRSPLGLGWPSLAVSGVASVQPGPDGLYTSFLAGRKHRLRLSEQEPQMPFILNTNGAVRAVEARASSEPELLLELHGPLPLELTLGGLPRAAACELRFGRTTLRGQSSDAGTLGLRLGVTSTGTARLACRASTGDG